MTTTPRVYPSAPYVEGTRFARIAVVADYPEPLARVLRRRSYDTTTLVSLTEGLTLLDDRHDLVIVASRLGDESGLELVAQLRNQHDAATLPVIVLTSGSEADYMRAFGAGASDCLRLDASSDTLLAHCANLLTKARQRKTVRAFAKKSELLFERYRIDGYLGEGSYGVVYAATDELSGRHVALKVLCEDASPEEKRRFLRETYAMACTAGPYLPSVHDSGCEDGRLYFAMERIEGPSLMEQLALHGAATESEAIALLRGMAKALAHIEKAGLLHRDIKPANIILRDGSYSSPVLVDFGLAKRSTDRGVTNAGMMLGTPGYMAPEAVTSVDLDHRSDLWSLGIVAATACEGGELFPHLSDFVLILATTEGPLPIPEHLSDGLYTLLCALTHSDVEQRIQDAAELLRRIDALALEA